MSPRAFLSRPHAGASLEHPTTPTMFGRHILCFLFALLCLLPAVRAARDDERMAQLREEIHTLETMAGEGEANAEKARLTHRVEMLRQELAILEKRQAIENKERELRAGQNLSPREQLRVILQSVPPETTAAEALVHDLVNRRAGVITEREALNRGLSELPKPKEAGEDTALTAKRAVLEEKLYTNNEQLQALALQQEAIDNEIDLVRQGQAARELLRTDEIPAHLSVRVLFSHRLRARTQDGASTQLNERMRYTDEKLRNSEAALDLARQKQSQFDEGLQLLERQTGFLRRNARADQLLASERAQKELLGERLPYLVEQTEALRRSRAALLARRDITTAEGKFLAVQLQEMESAYLRQLYGPLVIALVVIGLYVLISRAVLPRRYSKEELFLARRLGRYGVTLLIVVVAAVYLIEDLTLLATTLGLVSAAIVISVQDVFASFFGWFAIMFGRKLTIGDRLEIDGVRGDVLDVQILRTTLTEVNNWLGVDQPTGRVLFIPNSFIFKSKIFNFSHGHPYIWGKIDVTVTFGTPSASANALFTKVLQEETEQDFAAAKAAATVMERRYGVEDAEYRPKIYTRIADSGVMFNLIYVCHYRNSSTTRNRINRRLIAELETHPHIQLAYNTLTVQANASPTGQPSVVLGSDSTQTPFSKGPAG